MIFKIEIEKDCNLYIKADSKYECDEYMKDSKFYYEDLKIKKIDGFELHNVLMDYNYQTNKTCRVYLSDVMDSFENGILTDDFIEYRK